ncbi:hypothetical protein [Bradyrhizobium tropiciagri]|uniref:hypothetical protein n=1 Tax=Bradyrhizobium tropiciagri TaxID=312253 RepID=UPI00067CF90B|nr:hypothetical protein [Bradyrhizobium tropiciagri]
MLALRRGAELGAVPAQAAQPAAGLGEEHAQRFSFCSAVDRCRNRKTPPSFRFLGGKAWLGAVVVLVAAMRQKAAATRELTELFRVSRRTIERWGGGAASSPRVHSGRRPQPPSCRRSILEGCQRRCLSVLPEMP